MAMTTTEKQPPISIEAEYYRLALPEPESHWSPDDFVQVSLRVTGAGGTGLIVELPKHPVGTSLVPRSYANPPRNPVGKLYVSEVIAPGEAGDRGLYVLGKRADDRPVKRFSIPYRDYLIVRRQLLTDPTPPLHFDGEDGALEARAWVRPDGEAYVVLPDCVAVLSRFRDPEFAVIDERIRDGFRESRLKTDSAGVPLKFHVTLTSVERAMVRKHAARFEEKGRGR